MNQDDAMSPAAPHRVARPSAEAADSDPRAWISEKALIRVQAVSGLVFATFLVLHLGNLASATFGQPAYDWYMAKARGYYQLAPVELVGVVGAALVHMAAGVARILRRRARRADGVSKPPHWRVRLHRYSGYYLMAAFVGHVIATRGPGLVGHAADFSFLTLSLETAPYFFYPYYVLFAASGFYHLGHGTVAALRIVGARLPKGATSPRSRAFWAWAVAGATIAGVGVLSLGGHLHPVDRSRFSEWKAFYTEILPAGWSPW
jgi:succinate dehydrogenase/fumarate reductase cytochrome b subunit